MMRTTSAVREFTDDPLPDEVLGRILDNARFAPSGGNRQGAHVVVVRGAETRKRLAELNKPAARRYVAESGYDPTGEFLFGLDLILDGLDKLRTPQR